MLWLISMINKPDAEAKRDELRPQHKAYLESRRDALVLSGPIQSDDGKLNTGSIFLIAADTREEAQAFSDGEPFTRAGLYERVTITRIRKGQWNPEAAAKA